MANTRMASKTENEEVWGKRMTQEQAFELMKQGHNVMLTGPAGAGKSYLLQQFINWAKSKRKNVAITATTGLAAAHLSGQTIHSWAGLGIGNSLPDNYFYTMSDSRRTGIQRTDVLIIDEISMLHDYALDMVDEAMRIMRDDESPFGGLQVILCGDFFQLPPVGNGGRFVTESKVWSLMDIKVCYLEEQHRADDLRLQEILNAMRAGDMRQRHLKWLLSRMSIEPQEEVTRLYTTNADVENINNAKLAELSGDTHFYLRTSRGSFDALQQLQNNVLAPEVLSLKVGAIVMAVKNDPEGKYVNGSTGYVLDFVDGFPIVKFDGKSPMPIYPQEWEKRSGERLVASITQIPLRLAYAITVHKSQGMTLDRAEIDLSKAFVSGQGYVGLSRVRSLDSLYLKGINRRSLMVSSKAQEIDATFRKESKLLVK